MRRGEVYLAQFPFGDVPGMKLRPVLLLTGSVKTLSVLRLHKLATIHSTSLVRSLGNLDSATQTSVGDKLKDL